MTRRTSQILGPISAHMIQVRMEPQVLAFMNARWVEWLRNRRVEYRAICSSARSFARTAHSFAHSGAHGKAIYVYELNPSI